MRNILIGTIFLALVTALTATFLVATRVEERVDPVVTSEPLSLAPTTPATPMPAEEPLGVAPKGGGDEIDPAAFGYDTLEEMRADLREQLGVPDGWDVALVAEHRHGKDGLAIGIGPRAR
ncbi:MAG: hypothetical protein QGH45_12820 [Myxococcota bacterium]|jgi:hypothetical protein|nr:hypothetical protein [Myxococcota bacterium]